MIITLLQRFFLPFTCVLCGDLSSLNKDLCVACFENLPKLGYGCRVCGTVIPSDARNLLPMHISYVKRSLTSFGMTDVTCGQCLKSPPYFDRTIALFTYTHPIDKFIIALKFQQKLMYAKLLGELFAEYIAMYYQNDTLPELVIPVPLHKNRLRERGFNQALELSKPIEKKLNLKINTKSCQKIRHSEAQSLISAKHRQKNVKKSFAVVKNIKAKHIAILDDVMTTGHTVNELSKVLKNSGIEKIDVWCVARTI